LIKLRLDRWGAGLDYGATAAPTRLRASVRYQFQVLRRQTNEGHPVVALAGFSDPALGENRPANDVYGFNI
jgi:hypothetical protein